MSNDRTGQDNNWDDELETRQDNYDTEEPRRRRRRLPLEQPYEQPQRRPRPTSDFGQTQRPQRPRPTSDQGYSQGRSSDYSPDALQRRAYTDEQQQGRSRSSSGRSDVPDRTDRPQRQRPLTEYDEYNRYDEPQSPRPRPNTGSQSRQRQARQYSNASSQRERRSRKPRRIWPWLLFGCLGGIILVVIGVGIAAYLAVRSSTSGGIGIGGIGIGNTTTYTQNKQYPVQISTIAQLQIHNQIGNVTITVDPNATEPIVSTTKSVKASSQSDANSQFNSIAVQVQPAGTPATTLAVNASVSDNSSIFSNHNNSVAITVTLPPGVNTGGTPVVLNGGSTVSNVTSVGNVTITGLNGVLNVKNDIGNITVQQAMLSPGSTLETGTGNVTFNGTLDTASGSSGNQSIYTIQSEAGNLNVTLPANINVMLDAYTNSGNITTDFNLSQIKQSDGSYSGPIIYGTIPNALLKLHVSSGNVVLHKA